MKASKFSKVFMEQSWGNKGNAGVNYKRPYNKTRVASGLDNVDRLKTSLRHPQQED